MFINHMKKIIIFLLLLVLTNCSTKKLVNKHGLVNLDERKNDITIGKDNKNDILLILGPPSTISSFDDNTWIYIELRKVNQSLVKLGKKRIEKNNSLIVTFNSRGLVEKIDYKDLSNMNKINVSEKITKKSYSSNSKLYGVLTSLRERINAPAKRKRNKK